MKSFLVYITFLVLFNYTGFAGDNPKSSKSTIIITGKVIDPKNNEVLSGVKITCSNGEKVIYSSLNGQFILTIESISNEQPTVEFSQIGYISKTVRLKELQQNQSNLYIDLFPEEPSM